MSVQRTDSNSNPFLSTLQAALASGLPCKITERVSGRRYITEQHHPAHRVERIVEEGRRGAVAVMDDRSRIRVKHIVAVEMHRADRVRIAPTPGATALVTPYRALVATIREVKIGERY
jgi:hypothetical protein